MRYNNVNVNDVNKPITMNNVNVIENDTYAKSKQVEMVADKLLESLGANASSRPFMCKVAYKLKEHVIWNNLEAAKKGKNPMGLFIYLCKRDGV